MHQMRLSSSLSSAAFCFLCAAALAGISDAAATPCGGPFVIGATPCGSPFAAGAASFIILYERIDFVCLPKIKRQLSRQKKKK
jgi:hypothetical protein